jgi:hypothetical protein
MNHQRFFMPYAVMLLALLSVNPAMQAAVRKARPAQKEHTAKVVLPTQQEEFQKRVEQQIASLKEDVYTRATWKKLQEVKQEADDTAGSMKVVMLSAGGIGFALGCAVTFIFARRIGGSDENLKIT